MSLRNRINDLIMCSIVAFLQFMGLLHLTELVSTKAMHEETMRVQIELEQKQKELEYLTKQINHIDSINKQVSNN